MADNSPKSKRPYLLRALYDWIVDSNLTPYLVVAVNSEQVVVPGEFVSEGKIILNVSPLAVRNLALGNEVLTFDGRFSGNPFAVSAPIANVLAIYAKETGEGMVFEMNSGDDSKVASGPPRSGDHLKVVK